MDTKKNRMGNILKVYLHKSGIKTGSGKIKKNEAKSMKQIFSKIGILMAITILIFSNFFLFETDQMNKEKKNIQSESTNNEAVINEYLTNMKGFFTKNQGQLDNDDIYFTYSTQDKSFGFLESSLLIRLTKNLDNEENISSIVKITFENSNKVIPIGKEELSHKSNFFIKKDSSKWRSNVPNYEIIVYENIYDGIDLIYYFNEKGLKYDWNIKPYANANNIIERFEGVDSLNINSDGGIYIKTESGELSEEKPYSYQKIKDKTIKVDVNFRRVGKNCLTYNLGEYDSSMNLIIDPLIYSTFIGGNDWDFGNRITLDSENNIYITGKTESSDFPITTECFDDPENITRNIFIFKFKPDSSSLVYSTYIAGSKEDSCESINIDSKNNVYIIGETDSTDFPTTSGCYDDSHNGGYDVFIFKLNYKGSKLLYSTYIGGSGSEYGCDIALDSLNNTIITGYTNSADFPMTTGSYDNTKNGGYDIFILKINSDCSSLLYSTYIGGSNDDYGFAIAYDSENNAYITGETSSTNFPTSSGCFDDSFNGDRDVFVFKLKSDGSEMLYSSFIGGSSSDYGYDISIDFENNTIITGYTRSSDFPTTPGCYDDSYNGNRDAFIFKLKSDGSTLIYSTYIGGSGWDYGYGIATDSNNITYITGRTKSSDFPTTAGCIDDSYNGDSDIFLIKLKPDGSNLLYSTYVGGSKYDSGESIVIDSENNVYITGVTSSSNFPVTSDCYDDTLNGTRDVFLIKMDLNNYPIAGDLSFSHNEVFRTKSITFIANGSDFEDDERDLTPIFEYRSLTGDWESSWISNIKYNSVKEYWEGTFTPSKDAELGLYDFRLKFKDLKNADSKWLTKEDQVEVKNNLPIVADLSYSDTEVFRTKSITITSDCNDIENDESDLTPIFKYKSPTGIWGSSWISNIKYNSIIKDWEGTFTPQNYAELGLYDFQVKFQDKDNGDSNLLTINDQIEVKNNIPTADYISFSDNVVFRTNKITLTGFTSDFEDEERDLIPTFEYKSPTGIWESNWITNIKYNSVSGHWESIFTPPKDSELGYYDFKLRFVDLDNEVSNWLIKNDQVEVKNNNPTADDITYSNIDVFRTKLITIYANGTDLENDKSDLIITFEYKSPSGMWENNWISNVSYIIDKGYWEATFTPTKDAHLGLYDFQVKFTDRNNGKSNWLTEYDQLEVKNNKPTIIDFYYSDNEVLRTKSITLIADCIDVEDIESGLEPTLEYRSPTGLWGSSWISNINYNHETAHWEANFTPNKYAELGLYDFRVKFEDMDNGKTNWLIEYDQVEVKNNIPNADNLSYSDNELYRTKSITIIANSSDVEDDEIEITPIFEYKSPTGIWESVWISDITYVQDYWKATFTPSKDSELGFYDFQVKFEDLDNTVSNWLTENDKIRVKNNLPNVDDISYSKTEVFRTNSIYLYANGTDIENDEFNLMVTFEYRSPSGSWKNSWISNVNYNIEKGYWEAIFTTSKNAEIGIYDFRLKFEDLDNGDSNWMIEKDKVNVKNNRPIVMDLSYSETTVYRDKSITLTADSSDIEDDESEMTPIFEYKSPIGIWESSWISNVIYNKMSLHWEAIFTPSKNAELGLYDFQVKFIDTNNDISNYLTEEDQVEVLNNNPPIADDISFSNTEVVRMNSITILADGSDIEDDESDLTPTFKYKSPIGIWKSSGITNIKYNFDTTQWEALFAPPKDAELGLYDFQVRFTDLNDGISNLLIKEDQVLIKNNLPTAINLYYSDNEVFRASSITLIADSSDIEDDGSDLIPEFEYKSPKGNWESGWISNIQYNSILEQWEAIFTPLKDAELGLYDFQVKFTDKDEGESDWLTYFEKVKIKNNIPTIIDLNCSKPLIMRTETLIIYSNGNDIENDKMSLDCKIEYRSPNGNWVELKNVILISGDHWEATIKTNLKSEIGFYDFRVKFSDLDDGTTNWFTEIDFVFIENKTDIIYTYVTPNATVEGKVVTITAITNGPLNSTDTITSFVQKGDENIVETVILYRSAYRTYRGNISTKGLNCLYVIDFYSKDAIEDEIFKDNFACFAVSTPIAPKGVFTGYYPNIAKDIKTTIKTKSFVNMTLEIMINKNIENASFNIAEYSINPKDEFDGGYYIGNFVEIEPTKNIKINLKYQMIKIYYNKYSLPSWIEKDDLCIYYWNESRNEWEAVKNSEINIDENYLSANITKFGLYGLFVHTLDISCLNNIYYTKPNQVINYYVNVQNTGSVPDEISLSLLNVPSDWLASLNEYTLYLNSGEDKDLTLTIYVLTQEEGSYDISIYCKSTKYLGNIWDIVTTTTHIDKTSPISNAGSNQIIFEDEPAYFSGQDSTDNFGIDSYSWDFDASNGIQEEAIGMNVSHIFRDPGEYTVTLIVTDYVGQKDFDNCIITVLDTQPPDIPTNLTVYSIPIGNQLYISWDKNIDRDLIGYNIYRSLTSGIGYIKINTFPLLETTYQDTYLENNITYYYVITAIDRIHESDFSIEADGTPAIKSYNPEGNDNITDLTPPSIFSIQANPNKVVNGDIVEISAIVTDRFGVSEVKAFIQKEDEKNILEIQLFEISDGTYINTLSVNDFQGLYVIDIFAKDYNNNTIELENRACFAVTNDNSCTGIYQGLFNCNNVIIDARSEIDVILEINTKTDLVNSSICMAKFSKTWENNPGLISLNKVIEIIVENNLSKVIEDIGFKIYYTDKELGLKDENKLQIYNYNETSKTWDKLKTYVNTKENYLWANLTHFSIYGVFEQIIDITALESINGNPKETVVHNFTIKNLGIGDIFNFEVNSINGWNINLIGPNSVHINKDEKMKISVEVIIPANALAFVEDILIFNVSSTKNSVSHSISTKTIVNQISKVIVTANTPDQLLLPGQYFNYQFTVENLGNGEDNFIISAISTHDWAKIYVDKYIQLSVGKSKKVSVGITIPYENKIFAGTIDILAFEAKSKFSTAHSSVTVKTTVGQTFDVVLTCDINEKYSYVFPNDFFIYTLTLINNGNGKDTFDLNVVDKEENWGGTFSAKAVTLDGFESTDITLMIKPPYDEKADTKGVFTIRAESTSDRTKYDEISTQSTVPLPDIWIKDIYFNINDAMLEGQSIKIFTRICNSGSLAKDFWVKVSVLNSDIWLYLMDTQVNKLGPGKSTEIYVNWVAIGNGLNEIRAEVDHTDQIFESNEKNNDMINKNTYIVSSKSVTNSFNSSLLTICVNVVLVVILCSYTRKRKKELK